MHVIAYYLNVLKITWNYLLTRYLSLVESFFIINIQVGIEQTTRNKCETVSVILINVVIDSLIWKSIKLQLKGKKVFLNIFVSSRFLIEIFVKIFFFDILESGSLKLILFLLILPQKINSLYSLTRLRNSNGRDSCLCYVFDYIPNSTTFRETVNMIISFIKKLLKKKFYKSNSSIIIIIIII